MPKASAQESPRNRPASAPATEERGAATRHRILDATIDLLAEGGWAAVTTRAVAERAGVNAGLVHYHFGSIAGLLQAAVEAATEAALAEPMTALLTAPTLRSGVRRSLQSIAEIDERTARVLIEVLVRAGRDPLLRDGFAAALQAYRDAVADRVRAAQAAGELPADLDANGVAAVLAALGDGLALHILVDRTLSLEPALAALDRLLAPSIAEPAEEPRS